MKDLSTYRRLLGLSQSHLARLSGVSRFKICTFELGDSDLTATDQKKIVQALRTEADRLNKLSETLTSSFAIKALSFDSESH